MTDLLEYQRAIGSFFSLLRDEGVEFSSVDDSELASLSSKEIFAWAEDQFLEERYPDAMRGYFLAARLGSLRAACMYAYCLKFGCSGVSANGALAVRVYEEVSSIELDKEAEDSRCVSEALYWCGICYINGDSVEKDVEKGVRFLERSCALDQPWACIDLACVYSVNYRGCSYEPNWDRAHKLFLLATELPDDNGSRAEASCFLADFYAATQYFYLSDSEISESNAHLHAMKYYKIAADAGNVHAMCAYGESLVNGATGSAEREEGVRYLELARENESERASMLLDHPEWLTSADARLERIAFEDVKCDVGCEFEESDRWLERKELARIFVFGLGVPRNLGKARAALNSLTVLCDGIARGGTDRDVALFMTKLVSEHIVDDWSGSDEEMWWAVRNGDSQFIARQLIHRPYEEAQNSAFWADIVLRMGDIDILGFFFALVSLDLRVYLGLCADEFVIREGLTYLYWYGQAFGEKSTIDSSKLFSEEKMGKLEADLLEVKFDIAFAFFRLSLQDYGEDSWKKHCRCRSVDFFKELFAHGDRRAAACLSLADDSADEFEYARLALLPNIEDSLREIEEDGVIKDVQLGELLLTNLLVGFVRHNRFDEAYEAARIGARRGYEVCSNEVRNFKKRLFGGYVYEGSIA